MKGDRPHESDRRLSVKMMRCVTTALALALLATQLIAQTASSPLRFEVASIKPLPPGTAGGGYRPEPTRFSARFSLIEAVAFAYEVQTNRIVGGPEWAKSQRYEITATTHPARKPGELNQMMRQLLEERFSLEARRERRPMPVLALVMARSDGRLGPQLLRVERDCSDPSKNLEGCSFGWGTGRYSGRGQLWQNFVTNLEVDTARPVIDKTGLSGRFDIRLEWNPNISRLPEGQSGGPTLADLEARPVLFTALQEQLGLKLETATEPLDVVVIDGVDRPTPN